MRLHRVFPYVPTARSGEPGHPSYVPMSSGKNRLDNPKQYSVHYLAEHAAGAVAETLGQASEWTPAMLLGPRGSGARRALATYEFTGIDRVLDLDDAQALLDRQLRPTHVVRRNLSVTQAWALRIFEERATPRGKRRWDGVRWWSWYRPEWPVVGLWGGELELIDIESLDLAHPAVREAAVALGRVI